MTADEKILFEQLKKEVAATFLRENTALSPDISQWKGEDIVRFQEDLLHKVKGRVSEKWFYNYFRNDIQKLPRIDMLNLLSQYAGYQNWADFKQQYQKRKKIPVRLNKKYAVAVLVLILLAVWAFSSIGNESRKIRFCFTDENGQNIEKLKVTWLIPGESDKNLALQQNCVIFKSKLNEIRLKIESPYYKDVILTRSLQTHDYNEQIVLQTDLVALLLQHFSVSETKNWEKRRRQLENLIADNAMIYRQWLGVNQGIELYDKGDFIAQMCVPNGMIRNIKILEIGYKNKKINKLRFTVP